MSYLCNRAGLFTELISEQEAARLFAEASRRPVWMTNDRGGAI